jgi:hypothetical protein
LIKKKKNIVIYCIFVGASRVLFFKINKFKVMIKNLFLFVFCMSSLFAFGNDSIYVARQNAYVDSTLNDNSEDRFSLLAYRNLPIDSLILDSLLTALPSRFTQDFLIVELVRVLFYSNNLYDDRILAVLDTIPFWINDGDITRNYWSENHMIMWMSSEWLLHERYGRPIDNTLYPRIIHYLELKKEYGFYEFFSSTYSPYTLSGLLNLYDFSEDTIIKQLAMEVAQKLLMDLLKPTTDLGVFYPAAGRNYPSKYEKAYGQNHSSLIYLLTGFGEVPTTATHAGAFLATSSLPIDVVWNSWTPTMDTLITVGHSIDSSFSIHSNIIPRDRLIFQWSSTGYAYPSIIQETFQLLNDSSMWKHKDWQIIEPLSAITPANAPSVAELLNVITYGTPISGHDLRIFKNNSVALMSIVDLFKGKVGFQKWPVAATVGTTAVHTQSGEVNLNWSDREANVQNTHLPHVEQRSNLALVMYRPEPIPSLVTLFAGDLFGDKTVSLFWDDAAYDEIVEDGNWLMGRQNENYVAVRRSCTEKINTWWACGTDRGQTWVIMVGDSSMNGDFTNFQNSIAQAQFSENWYYDEATSQLVYQAGITVDALSVEYIWGMDSILSSLRSPINDEAIFSIYPNPSKDYVNLNLNSIGNQPLNIRVINSVGKEISSNQIDFNAGSLHTLQTSNWPVGLYTIIVESEGKSYYQKLIKH